MGRGRIALGGRRPEFPVSGQGPFQGIPGQVPGGPEKAVSRGEAGSGGRRRRPRLPEVVQQAARLPVSKGLGRVFEEAVQESRIRFGLPGPVHQPGGHLQRPHSGPPQRQLELRLQERGRGLPNRNRDDSGGDLHRPLPTPRATRRFLQDPAFRLSVQPPEEAVSRTHQEFSRCP